MSDAFLIQTPDNFYTKKNNLKICYKQKLKLKEINEFVNLLKKFVNT